MQGCHDLSLGWRRTDAVQYSQAGGGGVHHLPTDGSATASQRSHACFVGAGDSTDDSPQRQSSSTSFHRGDQYGIVDVARGPLSTRQPDAGLDLDLVDGVVDRTTIDGGGRPPRDPLPADRTPPFGNPTSLARREKNDRGLPRATTSAIPPRRVNFDVAEPVYRPACNCGTLSGAADHSPYYFKLDDVDAAVVTSAASDRSPLIAGRPVTSDARHADVMISSQCRDQL